MIEETVKKPGFIRRWSRRAFKTALVLVIVAVPTVYFGAPKLAKSAWARGKAEKALTAAAGTSMHIGKMEMTWKNGFKAEDVKGDTFSRGRVEITPSAKEIRFAPKVATLFTSHKARLTMVDPVIDVRERAEEPAAKAWTAPAAGNCCCSKKGIRLDQLVIENGRVTYDSDAFNQPVVLEKLNLRAEVQVRKGRLNIELSELKAVLNGGEISASGVIAIEPGLAAGKIDLDAANVDANEMLARVLKFVAPSFEIAAAGEVAGKISLKATVEGKGENARAMLKAATGRAELAFGGLLRGSRILEAIGARFDDPTLAAAPVDGVKANVQLADGRVTHLNTIMTTPAGAVAINGTVECTNLDLMVRLDPNLIMGRQGRAEEALRLLADQGGLRVKGTLSQPIVE